MQNSLPTAPDHAIAHRAHHGHLFRRIPTLPLHPHPHPHAEGIAPDVRRLAAELARLFEHARHPADLRRHMF